MNSFKSVADFASAVLGISTLCAIAYAMVATIAKRRSK